MPATCPLPLLANVSSHEAHFTALCQCLAPFSNCLKILVWGGREKIREGNPRAKERENIPGWRRGQGLPATSIQQSPQQNLSGSEGKVQRPGRARPRAGAAGSTSHPYSAEAGGTFHHLLSEKERSSQAERLLPGNLDCVATETTTSRERPALARRATGQSPAAPCRPGPTGQETHAVPGHYIGSKVGGQGQEGNRKKGRQREKEAGLDQLPSPFPSPSPEVGCPTLP